MAQFEIEIKLPLKNLKETLKFLTDQGFQETAQIQEEDTYFNSVYHDVKKRDEALRIRTSTDCRSGISKTQINFKGPKLDKISMSRMELETEVSDAEVLKNILIHLDFSPVASVMKTRKYLKCGRCENSRSDPASGWRGPCCGRGIPAGQGKGNPAFAG